MPVEDSIKNEISGDFERLMLAVGKKLEALLSEQMQNNETFCLTQGFFLGFSHSTVHKEYPYVFCHAPVQGNEGKHTLCKKICNLIFILTDCSQLFGCDN